MENDGTVTEQDELEMPHEKTISKIDMNSDKKNTKKYMN